MASSPMEKHLSREDALAMAIDASLQPQDPDKEALAVAIDASLQPQDPEADSIAAAIAASLVTPGKDTTTQLEYAEIDETRDTKVSTTPFCAGDTESCMDLCPPPAPKLDKKCTSSDLSLLDDRMGCTPQKRRRLVGKSPHKDISPGGGGTSGIKTRASPCPSRSMSINSSSSSYKGVNSLLAAAALTAASSNKGINSSSGGSSSSGINKSGGFALDAGGAKDDAEQAMDVDSAPGGQRIRATANAAGWVIVTEIVVKPTLVELQWIMEKVNDDELRCAVYTGRKVWVGLRQLYERTMPTSFACGAMPEMEPDWSSFQQKGWLHMPSCGQSEKDFNFQRVRVQRGPSLWSRIPSSFSSGGPHDSTSDLAPGEVRIIAEWNPQLAFKHMASRIGFHASHAALSCKIAPLQPQGWKPAGQEEEAEDSGDEASEDSEDGFFLSGCGEEAQASQPPRFRRYKLRPEQLRSLQWMLDREVHPAHFESEVTARFVPGVEWDSQPEKYTDLTTRSCADFWSGYQARCGFSWCYEPTVQATFSISGGVLGDAIGTGKTATLIGLLDSQRSKKPGPRSAPSESHAEASHLITTDATLILVPSNLLGQWLGEFEKFLGPGAFNFLVIRSISDLRKITVEELRKCEIVITTYKLLYSQDYVGRLKCLACTRTNGLHERSFYGQNIKSTLAEVEKAQAAVMASSAGAVGWTLRSKRQPEHVADREKYPTQDDCEKLLSDTEVEERIARLGLCDDLNKLPHPVFELFLWHRIVFDEFHELEAMDGRRRDMLQNLRSKHRWGLTGTPPKRDKTQIIVLAGMLRVRLAEDPAQCQHFLDTFVRQNFSELPEIPVKEHVIHVEHTIEERAIYLQQAFDGNRRRLLQFCSHHSLKGQEDDENRGIISAKSSVSQLEKEKREEQTEQKIMVEKEYQILAALTSGLAQGHRPNKAETDAKEKLLALEAQVRAFGDDVLNIDFSRPSEQSSLVDIALANIYQDRQGRGKCAEVLRCIKGSGPTPSTLRNAVIAQLGRCHAVLTKLFAMSRSLRFFVSSLSVLRGADGQSEAPECPICLETMTPETTALLPCAHVFHADCVQLAASEVNNHCPTCRTPFQPGEAVMVSNPSSKHVPKHIAKDVEAFGSKLVSVAQTLRNIRSKDPQAKAIVFVQWRDLEVLVGKTLKEMGIEHVRLQGATSQRSRLIAEFQENDMPWVLLQSLENSASGANLTRASHVLLVHPMDASSKERAVSYEMQALGRVRRCGQEAKEVHLYRFVTKGTIEEEITQEHQLGVSSRLQTGQSMAASSSSGH